MHQILPLQTMHTPSRIILSTLCTLVTLVSYYTFVYFRYSDVCYYYILNDIMMFYCNVKSTPLSGYQATGMQLLVVCGQWIFAIYDIYHKFCY